MNLTPIQLRHQLETIQHNGLYSLLEAAAEKHGLPTCYVVAVASRETNCVNRIGDGGRGVGILQADTQHEIARQAKADGTWQTHPERLIDWCVALLAANATWARKHWPTFDERQILKVAASAYNCGPHNAEVGIGLGDSDRRTTGRDYGRDTLERMDALKGMGVP